MDKINKIANLRDRYIQSVQQARASALLPTLIALAFENMAINIPQAATKLNVTYRAAKNNINRLVESDILFAIPGTRPQIFVAAELFELAFDVKFPLRLKA